MASTSRTFKLGPDLDDAANLRADFLGYPSRNAYIKGLIRYDLLVQGGHGVTLPMAALSPVRQDRIDVRLLELTRRGKGERGQLLTHIMQRVQGGASLPDVLQGEV